MVGFEDDKDIGESADAESEIPRHTVGFVG